MFLWLALVQARGAAKNSLIICTSFQAVKFTTSFTAFFCGKINHKTTSKHVMGSMIVSTKLHLGAFHEVRHLYRTRNVAASS